MTAIVECVPNFSEGRDMDVIRAITDRIESVEGARLLDVDPGEATHRTVVTFVGPPEAVLEAAFRAIEKAAELIDMRAHRGAHPRMGATDVCPFVPVSGVTMEECAELARRLGERVGRELGIPVYLYERAASRPERANLAVVRAGEYEGLAARLGDPEDGPDFGPREWNERVARTGATAIGARPFLIAWNVNLNTKNVRRAMKIAALIREKGIIRRDGNGEIVRDENGRAIRDPGMFKGVKAIGWFIDEYDRCQVSMNVTDHHAAPLHEIMDAIRRVADREGVVVTGSELVGLVPLDALVEAGRHYLRRQGLNPGAPVEELVTVAVRSLGLDDLKPFDPRESVIEWRIGGDGPLVRRTVRGFADLLSSDAPAPGGGSVAALAGALSGALAAMVGALTTGRKGYEAVGPEMEEMAIRAQALKDAFLADVDADTAAFDRVMAAMRMPRRTDEERVARARAMEEATLGAIEVPLRVLERVGEVLDCVETALRGNDNARSDAGVAALLARTAAEAAYYNVLINLPGLADEARRAALRSRADAAFEAARERAEALAARVRAELAG